jgi:hypothetical protein
MHQKGLMTNKIVLMSKKLPAGVSAEVIAKIANVSVQLVYKKLSRGKTPVEIIIEAARWHEMQVASKVAIPVVPFDSTAGANGADTDLLNGCGNLSFAAAQTMKENALAQLRELEVMQKRGELIPLSYVRHWGGNCLIAARNVMDWGPTQIRDELAAEIPGGDPVKIEGIVRRWLEPFYAEFERLGVLWNQPLPAQYGG